MNLPFAPTTLSAIVSDLAYLAVPAAVTLAANEWRAHREQIVQWYRSRTTAQERAVLGGYAHDAVLWAERFLAGSTGQEKFRQATQAVQGWLDRRGIAIDLAQVEAAVQSAYAGVAHDGTLAASAGVAATTPGVVPHPRAVSVPVAAGSTATQPAKGG